MTRVPLSKEEAKRLKAQRRCDGRPTPMYNVQGMLIADVVPVLSN